MLFILLPNVFLNCVQGMMIKATLCNKRKSIQDSQCQSVQGPLSFRFCIGSRISTWDSSDIRGVSPKGAASRGSLLSAKSLSLHFTPPPHPNSFFRSLSLSCFWLLLLGFGSALLPPSPLPTYVFSM